MRSRLIAILAVSYAASVGVVTWQAMIGESIISPSLPIAVSTVVTDSMATDSPATDSSATDSEVTARTSDREAQRAFRLAIIISALRCLITYLAIPVLIPIAAISGAIATPVSMGLTLFAVLNGAISLRRFWALKHRYRWVYTVFISVVFVVLALALVVDIKRLAGLA